MLFIEDDVKIIVVLVLVMMIMIVVVLMMVMVMIKKIHSCILFFINLSHPIFN